MHQKYVISWIIQKMYSIKKTDLTFCFINKIVWLNYSGLFVVFFSWADMCTLSLLPCLNGAPTYRRPTFHAMVNGFGVLFGGDWGGWGGWLIRWSLARLPEEVQPCAIFPLGPLHARPVCQYPGSLHTAVGDMHQSDCNSTFDVPARLRVGLPPLGDQATG